MKAALKDGWKVKSIKGSHYKLERNGRITVIPMHNKDIPIGMLNQIKKQLGLK
ncbi:MAG: type II toxin-antitoxin system HicA family toxin [Eubacteriales bacterium]|nr:type II toxin-antitoxin system HicA family toxin [Eubacteriales bacterium]